MEKECQHAPCRVRAPDASSHADSTQIELLQQTGYRRVGSPVAASATKVPPGRRSRGCTIFAFLPPGPTSSSTGRRPQSCSPSAATRKAAGSTATALPPSGTASRRNTKPAVTLKADDLLAAVRAWIATRGAGTGHQGFPVVDVAGDMVGLVTRRDLLDGAVPDSARVRDLVRRPVAVAFEDSSLREAADHIGAGRSGAAARGLAVVGAASAGGHADAQRPARRAQAPPRRHPRRRAKHRLAQADAEPLTLRARRVRGSRCR